MASNYDCSSIYIKGLDFFTSSQQIYVKFVEIGVIKKCKLQQDEYGKSRGTAIVTYGCKENAEKAVSVMNGTKFGKRTVQVSLSLITPKSVKLNKNNTNCFIKNFGILLNDQLLKKLFEKFGNIKSSKVILDDNGISKGFGFVNFEKSESAEKAINEIDGVVLKNKVLYVAIALDKNERHKQNKLGLNLYVNNLSKAIDDNRLKKEFSSYGKIESAKVILDELSQKSKRFGFVCFKTSFEAFNAIKGMNGKMLDGKVLNVTMAKSKENVSVKNKKNISNKYLTDIINKLNQNTSYKPKQNIFLTNMSMCDYDFDYFRDLNHLDDSVDSVDFYEFERDDFTNHLYDSDDSVDFYESECDSFDDFTNTDWD